MMSVYYIIAIDVILGYLLGSISSSILVGKVFGVGDIRKHGSGNAGATNTLRVLGKKAAIFTVVGDILKAVIAVLVARFLAGAFITDSFLAEISVYAAAFAVVLGHNFPIYFGFKGGKGVLTSGVIIIMLNPVIGTATVVTALVIMALSKYVSLGSITAGIMYPVWICIYYSNVPYKMVFAVVLGLMLVVRHRANIKRLLSGTENKLGAKK